MPQEPKRRSDTLARIITFLGLSLVLHVIALVLLMPIWPLLTAKKGSGHLTPVTVLMEHSRRGLAEDKKKPEDKKDKDKKDDDLEKKQIVEVAPPEVEKTPDTYKYLSEHDNTVDEQTRTDQFRLDAKVLAPTFSHDDAMQFKDLQDLGAQTPSTGAKAGNDRFDPSRDGSMASVPSLYKLSNKDGLDQPAPSSHRDQNLAGSPSNDLLDEKLGEATNVNTKAVLYAGYINRIKHLVSFYWSQNLDNLGGEVHLLKPRYDTVVYVVLDGNGAVESVEVTGESGIPPLDDAVVKAFRVAGPFPNPPEQLIAKDGRIYLDDLGFTVEVGAARPAFVGIDPRAGVQFPGILKASH